MLTEKSRQDEIYDALRASAESLLAMHGVSVTKKTANQGTWLNMSSCAWCSHGPTNFQCGIFEKPGLDGSLLHLVKCFHHEKSNPHYADFLSALGVLTAQEAEDVKTGKSNHRKEWPKAPSRAPARPLPPVEVQPSPLLESRPKEADVGRLNEEHNARLRKRLWDNSQALKWLRDARGLTEATIKRFKLGLSMPYKKTDVDTGVEAVEHADALAAPLVGRDGLFRKKYVNYAIPGVTVDNRVSPARAWSPGPPMAYYSGRIDSKKLLFVCDGLKDVWALAQLLDGSDLDKELVLVSSSTGGLVFPAEWRDPMYWVPWFKVFAGQDNDQPNKLTGRKAGDEQAKAVAEAAGRDVFRVSPPGVKDWNEWTLQGHTANDFRRLLEDAELISAVPVAISEDDGTSFGEFEANMLPIVGAYHNGHLYEAVRTLVRRPDPETGEVAEQYDTIIIRSDRTRHRVKRMHAIKGVAEQNQVWRLYPDGAMLSKLPQPNPNLTWSWPSIKRWLEGTDRTPPLKALVRKVHDHLKASTWLPYEGDYVILACAVAASYVQQVFDAVPLLLVTGAAATGKSQLGFALKSLGANSKNVLGVVSAATIARYMDSTRGLVVIDDLEEIASGKDSQFGDLIQTLKLSYKKSTAMKMVTELRPNGQAIQREFNYFGIKVINNTRGTDAILGTRMMTIQTRKMPSTVQLDNSLLLSPEQQDELRDDLHTWAFTSVTEVASTYQAIFPNKTSRQEEIAAPLRVVAALTGDADLSAALEQALARQAKVKANPDGPEDILKDALHNIIRRSIEVNGLVPTWVTVQQVSMEMLTLVDNNYGKDFTTSLSVIEKPEWVGRVMSQNYADPNAEQKRTNMYGKGLRAYKLADDFLSGVTTQMQKDSPDLFRKPPQLASDFKTFCRGCSDCPYRNRCEMQLVRESKEREGPRATPTSH